MVWDISSEQPLLPGISLYVGNHHVILFSFVRFYPLQEIETELIISWQSKDFLT